jgi:tetratricopeptide (TPR) repeat protein
VNHAPVLVLAIMVSTVSATAQPSSPSTDAEAALEEGRRLYDLQEWDQAIAKFKEAYRLRADAAALFNIAQSYRLKGDCASAAGFYKTYRRNFPNERNIDKVDRFIVEMEECAKTSPRPDPVTPVKPDPVPPGPVTPEPVTPAEPAGPVTGDPAVSDPVVSSISGAPDSAEGGSLRLAGLGVAAIGVVSIGASVAFGLRARAAASEAEALPAGSTWDPSIEERGDRAAGRALVFAAIGGAAVVTGGVLYVLGQRRTERGGVTVAPTPSGATLVWASSF